WIEPNNWVGGAVPDGTATFPNTGQANVANDNGAVVIGGIQFTSNAQIYSFAVNNAFIVTGARIHNASLSTQLFGISAGNALVFHNNSSASAGTGAVVYTVDSGGSMNFVDNSTVGSGTITNNGVVEFDNSSTAGGGHITNQNQMFFLDAT